MRYVIHAIFLIALSIIQPTWIEYIELLGVKPNLFLIYTIIFSCRCSKKEGATVGFFFGLTADLLIGKAIGLNACLMLILSFAITDFSEKYIRNNNIFTTVIIVLVSALLYDFVYYIIAFLGDLNLGTAILTVIIPQSIYCALAAVPLYFVVPKREPSE